MPAANPFTTNSLGPTAPALSVFAITPNDGVDLAVIARSIFVGTGGNVEVIDTAGNTVVHKNVSSGSYIGPFFVARVKAANTTATDLVGYA